MNRTRWNKFVDRDQGAFDTGYIADSDVPQHRRGRQAGGSRYRDNPANIISLSSLKNGLIESNAHARKQAYRLGWTLREGDSPLLVPAFHAYRGWVMLDDEFNMKAAPLKVVVLWEQQVKEILGEI